MGKFDFIQHIKLACEEQIEFPLAGDQMLVIQSL